MSALQLKQWQRRLDDLADDRLPGFGGIILSESSFEQVDQARNGARVGLVVKACWGPRLALAAPALTKLRDDLVALADLGCVHRRVAHVVVYVELPEWWWLSPLFWLVSPNNLTPEAIVSVNKTSISLTACECYFIAAIKKICTQKNKQSISLRNRFICILNLN